MVMTFVQFSHGEYWIFSFQISYWELHCLCNNWSVYNKILLLIIWNTNKILASWQLNKLDMHIDLISSLCLVLSSSAHLTKVYKMSSTNVLFYIAYVKCLKRWYSMTNFQLNLSMKLSVGMNFDWIWFKKKYIYI